MEIFCNSGLQVAPCSINSAKNVKSFMAGKKIPKFLQKKADKRYDDGLLGCACIFFCRALKHKCEKDAGEKQRHFGKSLNLPFYQFPDNFVFFSPGNWHHYKYLTN
jgi:hypothetical protein